MENVQMYLEFVAWKITSILDSASPEYVFPSLDIPLICHLGHLFTDKPKGTRFTHKYSGRTLKWCMTFVPIIRTSKPFWLLQCIWHQTRVTYLWCTTTCSHQNHCIWSQELWEHKFLVLKNGLLFCRSMVEWVCLLHKMIIKDLKMLQMKQKTTEGWLRVYMHWF